MQAPNARWLASQNPCTSTIGWWTLNLMHRGIFNDSNYSSVFWELSNECGRTDSSHWMANCHKSCKMNFAITMTGSRRPRRSNNLATSESMTRFDATWGCIKLAEKLKCILALIPLHAQNAWVRSIISNNDRPHGHDCLFLIIQGNSRPICLINLNAPNFNSWIVSSRISFNSLTVSVSVSMSST